MVEDLVPDSATAVAQGVNPSDVRSIDDVQPLRQPVVRQPDTLTLTCQIYGDVTGPVKYAWDFDGDGDVDFEDFKAFLNR